MAGPTRSKPRSSPTTARRAHLRTRSALFPPTTSGCCARSSRPCEEAMKPSFALLLLATACGTDKSDADYQKDVVTAMHASIAADLARLVDAAKALQAAAPTGHAWSASGDAAAIAAMKEA